MVTEFIALPSAAERAYLALAEDACAPLQEGVLDVVAIALAACMPIYGAREADEPLNRLSDADMAGGRFVQGASRLHFPGGAKALVRLAVKTAELEEGIERLKRAGVNFSQARFSHAPRRIPRITPA